MDNFPTVESIKAEYPNPITADANEGLVRRWLEGLPEDKKTVSSWDGVRYSHINTYVGDDIIETDEFYPQCNYCIGGALQMAFGETEQDNVDDSRDGIFPASDVLSETLHYFCQIPFDEEDEEHRMCEGRKYPCFFPEHKGQDCFTQSGETANDLADKITRANDRGDFDEAWSYVEFALKLGRKNLEENK